MASVTYSSQVLPASRISAKRQLAMLNDSYGTMITAVAIVLRRQGFMADCIVGTWGWSIVPELAQTMTWWEREFMARVDYIVKGNNPQHQIGVRAFEQENALELRLPGRQPLAFQTLAEVAAAIGEDFKNATTPAQGFP